MRPLKLMLLLLQAARAQQRWATALGPGRWPKLLASDGAGDDRFGYSVAVSGAVAVVGAYRNDDAGDGSGSAYVFEQQQDGSWLEAQKLVASDGVGDDRFGYRVAVSGAVAVVGAYYDDDAGDDSGSAYVFERQPDGSWLEVQKLVASDGAGYDYFGCSVAVSGTVAVVGARLDDDAGDGSGSAYVFEQQDDGSWLEAQKLVASDGAAGDYFGASVAVSGAVAVVGA
eukprot:COSAG04_NODE_6285_length_1365_cov_10.737757_1_plen_226_part_01